MKQKLGWLIFLSITTIGSVFGQTPDLTATAETETGAFVFEEVKLFRPSSVSGEPVADPTGFIVNKTGVQWKAVSFHFVFTGKAAGGTTEMREFNLEAGFIGVGKKTSFSRYLPSNFRFLRAENLKVEFLGGERELTEEETAQKATDDELERKSRGAAIRKLPRLQNGSEAIFVATDQSCLRDFLVARAAGGLVMRKKVAELILYKCGVIVDAGMPARVITRSGTMTKVEVVNADLNQVASGWVQSSWLVTGR